MERATPIDHSTPPVPRTLLSMRSQQRLLLGVAIGGLLAMLVAVGAYAVSCLGELERKREDSRARLDARMQILLDLSQYVYRSGTRVHDFLMDTDPAVQPQQWEEVAESRRHIEASLKAFAPSVQPEERELFASLEGQVDDYFATIMPVFDWTAEERRQQVDVFIRDQMHPRRAMMLRIAEQIEALNQRNIERNAVDTRQLFAIYRQVMLVMVSVAVGLGVILAVFSVTRILKLERESDNRFRQVEHAKAELQALSSKLVNAQETERRKLARDLHDEIGQGLWAIVLGLGNASSALEHGELPEVREQLGTVRGIADGMVRNVRNLALVLRPSVLDDLGLIPAIKWLGRETARTTPLRVEVSTDGVQDDLRDEYRTCIYRIVQEALRNSHRHAAATRALVLLEQDDKTLHLSVSDDGRGFEPSQERGLGILGMEERVTHLGGSLRMRSSPGAGTVIDVLLPVAV